MRTRRACTDDGIGLTGVGDLSQQPTKDDSCNQLICAAYDRLGSSTTPAGEATRSSTSASPPITTVRPSSCARTPTFKAYPTEPKALTGTLSSSESVRKPNSPSPSALKLSSLVPIVASCGLLRWRAGYCPPIKASQSGRPSIRLQLS